MDREIMLGNFGLVAFVIGTLGLIGLAILCYIEENRGKNA
jgi:hypothetical protein